MATWLKRALWGGIPGESTAATSVELHPDSRLASVIVLRPPEGAVPLGSLGRQKWGDRYFRQVFELWHRFRETLFF